MTPCEGLKTILITGANGFIGVRLATAAFSDGYIVKTLSRSTEAIPSSISSERRYVGQLPHQIPADALQNVDMVVHCAAWMKGGREMAQSVNVQGTLRLAEMARQAKVQTFIFLSSQSSGPDAVSDYGQSKYEAEQTLLSEFSHSGMNIIIIRPGLVTGPGQQGLYPRLCRTVEKWPVLPLVDGGKQIIQPVHVDDLCRAILSCSHMAAQPNGTVLKLGHPEGATLAEFFQQVSLCRLGHRKATITIPVWPVRMLVGAAERIGLTLPVTSENLKGLTRVERMDTQQDMAHIGLPARSIDIIVRDDMNYDQRVLREADFMTRYLLGIRCSQELKVRYARAIERLKIELEPEERRLWLIVNRYPSLLRIVDGGLAFLKPHGGIRRKIYTMMAILEASPEHAGKFLPQTCTRLHLVGLMLVGFWAAFATVIGMFFIKVIKFSWR